MVRVLLKLLAPKKQIKNKNHQARPLMCTRALFLDRDGVINLDYGYVHRQDQIHFVDGIFEVCRYACRLGFAIIVVTNQAGIGRGFYSQEDFAKLMCWMKKHFSRQGCPIDDIYWCPYHPTEGVGSYRKESFNRKPNPGMIFNAVKKYNILLSKSVLIGDNLSDMIAGNAAGVGFNLLYQPPIMSRLGQKNFFSQQHCPLQLPAERYIKISHLTDAIHYLKI